jgi:hypothetical protein
MPTCPSSSPSPVYPPNLVRAVIVLDTDVISDFEETGIELIDPWKLR